MTDLIERLRGALDEDTAHVTAHHTLVDAAARLGRRRQLRTRAALVAAPLVVAGAALAVLDLRQGPPPSTLTTASPTTTPAPNGQSFVEVDGVHLPVPAGFRLVSVAHTLLYRDGNRRTSAVFAPLGMPEARANTGAAAGTVEVTVLRGDRAAGPSRNKTFESTFTDAQRHSGVLQVLLADVSSRVDLEVLGFDTDPAFDLHVFSSAAVDSGSAGTGPVYAAPSSGPLG